ncbi:NPC intracellular cholesterol transporter 2 homolog a-like [Homarus americanus]|uniref:NPC intracellular cholesterol transporter 2 a-like n=1 Tax=Homarus americanus TaxID=6706 RepID=A0A8J5JV07_HOMAM|nr:NPC intracellular cholesterol transporter 2 homolog a-like [Homarus americanus]KAG7164852.1 NPC intracellular cholesterol transporter 2 a-like [Homarus americanus]
MRGYILVTAVCLASTVSATFFEDCGSVGSDVKVEVEGCNIPPCHLPRGDILDVNIQFTSSRNTETLKIAASAYIGGIEVPWPGVNTDACINTQCPITEGSRVNWLMPVNILKVYPKITTIVTFKLLDSAKEPQACVVIPATIV